jgi:hypothetical protein
MEPDDNLSERDFPTCCHCSKSGTCSNGDNDSSCERCIAKWRKEYQRKIFGREYFTEQPAYRGLVCSVCRGKGVTEPTALKWERRFPFSLASGLTILGFLLLLLGKWVGLSAQEALPFVGTLLGSITGYYFGQHKAQIEFRGKSVRPPATTPLG